MTHPSLPLSCGLLFVRSCDAGERKLANLSWNPLCCQQAAVTLFRGPCLAKHGVVRAREVSSHSSQWICGLEIGLLRCNPIKSRRYRGRSVGSIFIHLFRAGFPLEAFLNRFSPIANCLRAARAVTWTRQRYQSLDLQVLSIEHRSSVYSGALKRHLSLLHHPFPCASWSDLYRAVDVALLD